MRVRLLTMAAVIALLSTACYFEAAFEAEANGDPVPWFCDPVNPNSVTGPGMGTTNWYAGVNRAPLDYETCKKVALQFDLAKDYAEQYPTLGDAEANDFRPTFARINGMGTHHGLKALTPAQIADPSFDRFNPVFEADSPIDDVFDPAQPEFLQYDGNGPNAVLVGMSYYVRTDDGQPPEGFAGDNDWWHHHPTLCLDRATAVVNAVNTTDATCNGSNINVHFDDYYMLHVWVVDDMELRNDIHSAFHPCIVTGGAIFDMDDPCHDGDSTTIPGQSEGAAEPKPFFCPLGQLVDSEDT